MKKAQITIFIVIGIVILLMIFLGFYVMERFSGGDDAQIEEITNLPEEIIPVKLFVDSCIKEVTVPGVYLLASNGGYIYYYDSFVRSANKPVAYHYNLGEDISPTKEFMEEELAFFIKNSLRLCVDGFASFNENIEYGDIEANVEIGESQVFIDVDYPITLTNAESKLKISKFKVNFPIRLGHILAIKEDVGILVSSNDWVDLNELTKYDVQVNMLPYDKSTIIYSIYDPQSDIDNAKFIFNFAVNLTGNTAPTLEFIPDFVLTRGSPFTYAVKANEYNENDKVIFSSSNPSIIINQETGVMSFTLNTLGEHETEVCVEDSFALKDCMIVRFLVE